MKKIYIIPITTIIELDSESCLLAGSADNIFIDTSEEEAHGSEALSYKRGIWDTEDMWQ